VILGGSDANVDFTSPLVTAGGNPDATVILTFKLTVTDPNGATDSHSVDVTVANIEHAPTAVTGENQTVNEAAAVTLNGTASSDPDGDALTYAWVQTSGPVVTLNDANTALPYFTAPFVNAAGATLKFQLIVSDGFGGNNSASMSVTVQNINDPPVVASARPSVATLWPPDHSMVKVSILGIVDPNNNATIRITSVTQDHYQRGQHGAAARRAFGQWQRARLSRSLHRFGLRRQRLGRGDRGRPAQQEDRGSD